MEDEKNGKPQVVEPMTDPRSTDEQEEVES